MDNKQVFIQANSFRDKSPLQRGLFLIRNHLNLGMKIK